MNTRVSVQFQTLESKVTILLSFAVVIQFLIFKILRDPSKIFGFRVLQCFIGSHKTAYVFNTLYEFLHGLGSRILV